MKEGTGVLVIGMVIVLAGIYLAIYSVKVEIPSSYNYWTERWEYTTINVYPYQLIGAIVCLIGVVTAIIGGALGSVSEKIAETSMASRVCPSCGKNLSNLPQDIKACPYCAKTLPEPLAEVPQKKLFMSPEERLLQKYEVKYPHNPKGVLEFHVSRKTKEGKTREQAINELLKESK